MKNIFVIDANVILRYLLDDHPNLSKLAMEFMTRVKTGEQEGFIPEGVLVECVYVLLKLYRVPRTEIAGSLEGILNYKGVVNQDLAVLRKALGLFAERNVDIVDAIVHALAEERGWSCFSFDKDMDKLQRQ